jgi:hypothetical protein
MSEDRARVVTVTHTIQDTEELLLEKVQAPGEIPSEQDMDADGDEASTHIGFLAVTHALLQHAELENEMSSLQEFLEEWQQMKKPTLKNMKRSVMTNFKSDLAVTWGRLVPKFSEEDFNNLAKLWPSEDV